MKVTNLPSIQLPAGKKIYFAGDFHFGIPNKEASKEREQHVITFLEEVAADAAHIFLMGDLFDAWMEYKSVVPKGHIKFLACLVRLREQGIPITVFSGNHDLWMYGYFEEELNIPVLHQPASIQINQHHFFLAHGDGLSKKEIGYRLMKGILRNKICQWLYRWLHPDWGFPLAAYLSSKGVHKKNYTDTAINPDQEFIIQFAREYLVQQPKINYFICGHRHRMIEHKLSEQATYLNTGDWIFYNSYVVYDGQQASLKQWQK